MANITMARSISNTKQKKTNLTNQIKFWKTSLLYFLISFHVPPTESNTKFRMNGNKYRNHQPKKQDKTSGTQADDKTSLIYQFVCT